MVEFTRDWLGAARGGSASVLLEGEGGTGKTTLARELHRRSARAAGPLVEVALEAQTPTLLEAALFGHEEGAFTGAQRAREGYFRRADGGTLVLEGLEVLPAELQPKLLRVLQERRVQPLGGEAEFPLDVRVLATCGDDLQARVRAGTFRPDLYYRLAVLRLRVPPLRARLEDLPALAAQAIARVCARDGLSPRALTTAALERLAAYSWPGNLRELENALARVLALPPATGAPIGADEFAFLEQALGGEAEQLARRALAAGLTLAELEGALLRESLAAARGVVSAAARSVGLTRRAFEYRLARGGAAGQESDEE